MRTLLLATALIAGAANALAAQPPVGGADTTRLRPPVSRNDPSKPLIIVDGVIVSPPAEPGDPLATHLFPPDLIMLNQQELGLGDAQRERILREIQQAQARFVELQWRMTSETQQLEALFRPATVDEGAVLAQIDRTLAVEREIKRAQIALLVRIRNALTPDQRARLAEIRGRERR